MSPFSRVDGASGMIDGSAANAFFSLRSVCWWLVLLCATLTFLDMESVFLPRSSAIIRFSRVSAAPPGPPVADGGGGGGGGGVACPFGTLRLASLFSGGLVLQRGVPTRVWGWAHHGCGVGATLAVGGGRPLRLLVEHRVGGLWVATVPPRAAGGGGRLAFFTTAGDAAAVEDVAWGEVLLCLGQSNMQSFWPGGAVDAALAVDRERGGGGGGGAPRAEEPLPVRYFGVGAVAVADVASLVGEPLEDFPVAPMAAWVDAGAAGAPGVANLSAVCWFAGREVARALGGGVPVGLVEAALGGSYLVHWCDSATAAACDAPEVAADRRFGLPARDHPLWNAFLGPLGVGPLAVAAAAWYQGESEALAGQVAWYECGLPRFIGALRALLGAPALWLGIVQLAPFFADETQLVSIPALRNAQARAAARVPQTTLVPALDAGDPWSPHNNLHPRTKRVVGERLGAAAAAALLRGEGGGGGGAPPPHTLAPVFSGAAADAAPAGGGERHCTLRVTVAVDPASLPAGGGGLQWAPWEEDSWSTRCPLVGFEHFCAGFEVQDGAGAWHNASATLLPGGARLQLVAAPRAGVRCGEAGAPAPPAVATRNGWAPWPVVNVYAGGLPLLPWPPTPLLPALP